MHRLILLGGDIVLTGSVYGGEYDVATVLVDGTTGLVTPDGMMFFSTTEQLLDYIVKKCGADVAACIQVADESDYPDIIEELTEIVGEEDLYEIEL